MRKLDLRSAATDIEQTGVAELFTKYQQLIKEQGKTALRLCAASSEQSESARYYFYLENEAPHSTATRRKK